MPKPIDSNGWQCDLVTECDRCHHEKPCCTVDFWDGEGVWDYCQKCWKVLIDRGAIKSDHWG